MSEETMLNPIENLAARFPEDWIKPDPRTGYSGYIVSKEHLLEFARTMRDEYGFDYLSMVTAADYLEEGFLEIIYYAYKIVGGPALVYKVQVPRDNAIVPSLVGLYPGVDFQEREVWDLFGVRFEGHPDLRRILTWEGFAGHPLRKDWKEPFYEEDVKPFKSRWPDGKPVFSDKENPFDNNVQYPVGFDPDHWTPDEDTLMYAGLLRKSNEEFKTDQLVVNMGPAHPSTHGVFRMVVSLDGESIVDLKPVMGYMHRNHEKIGERNTFLQNMPYTDRLDYVTSMMNNFGYALAVEKLMGIQVTERAEYIRVLMAELTRIMNHFFATGFLLNDLGAYFTPSLYAIEERELILDIFEEVSGSRMMCNYFRFGGVVRDVSDHVLKKVHDLVYDRLPRKLEGLDAYLTNNEILRSRCEGVGVLTAEQAISLSAAGPILRASGVPYDVRRADPYSIYDRLEFDVVTGMHGDIYDRYLVRLEEIRQSIRIIKQVLRDIPEGPILPGKPAYQVRVPAGEAYGRIEGTKGELGFYVVSNGKPNPARYHVRAPTFINLTSLAPMCRGEKVADSVVILGSIDITLGEVDR
ncbi:NADH:ubiquinone oxidoreductase 49 kD subunit 7 [Longilinea arvoryzae]|uniref:NADH-quinone oxidoreductase subunit D n=2 Tax=Longilinea arvoryzae TaxID=360412 RepID=A0A0S7BLD6_9CHLR|nr:NADH-quinone oxidoreductase subunit D [Longilinea arvoryzae]GAP14565.1 NADH:ubiquinone oxidoreductase 49 kD subunit 7 [Longilinea arvoryzae]